MNKSKEDDIVYLRCSCGCSTFVIERHVFDKEDINYNIFVQDSRYDHRNCTLLGKVKSAIRVLFGKPVYYNDVYIEDSKKFADFVQRLQALVDKDRD